MSTLLSLLVGEASGTLREPNSLGQNSTFRNDPELDEAPQRDQQLPRQCHDPDLAQPFAAASETRPVPLRELALWLEAKPTPGLLDRHPAHPAAAVLPDAPLPRLLATLVRCRRQLLCGEGYLETKLALEVLLQEADADVGGLRTHLKEKLSELLFRE